MSLDIEGAEERIIRSLTVERPTPNINKILFENDYIFVRNSDPKTPYDTFYIHKSIDRNDIKKENFSQIPKKSDKL